MSCVGTSPDVVGWCSILRTGEAGVRRPCLLGWRKHTDRFALEDLAENDVFSVQMMRLRDGDEELGTVGVFACVGLYGVR
jgi:hypothetical protein